VVMREVQRKLDADQAAVAASGAAATEPGSPKALSDLGVWLQRAERIRTQQRNSKNKLYALHAPEVECISKGKARNPYEAHNSCIEPCSCVGSQPALQWPHSQ